MTAKKLLYDTEAREAVLRGVQKLARAVKVTLGPAGRVVVMSGAGGRSPRATKDGVSVAKEIEFQDAYENMGADVVRQAANRTSELAGDGTTTATLYAEAIFTEGLKNVTGGADAMQLKRGIERGVADLTAELLRMARPVSEPERLVQVATCSANHDQALGKIVAEAIQKVGQDGLVTVDDGSGMETVIDLVEGMQFDRGYLSPHFVNQAERMEAVLEDTYVLLCEKRLASAAEVLPLLEKVVSDGKPLLIIAGDVEGEVITMLVLSARQGSLKVCAVKAPGFGEQSKAVLEDIAAVTGARAIMEELGERLENLELRDLGRAKKVVVDKEHTTIIEGGGDPKTINARTEAIHQQVEEAESEHDRQRLQERLARLIGGAARIRVGGATESEMHEKKSRVEDAVRACRAALEEGVLPGGGVAVLRAKHVLAKTCRRCAGDEQTGVNIVERVLSAPLFHIAQNAGLEGPVAVAKVLELEGWQGLDALTGRYCDLLEQGIIVPAKVERIALEQGASVAGLLLTVDAAIGEADEDEISQANKTTKRRQGQR